MPNSGVRENRHADAWIQVHESNQTATASHDQRSPDSSDAGASVGDEAPLAAVRGNESECVVEISEQSCTRGRPRGRSVPRHGSCSPDRQTHVLRSPVLGRCGKHGGVAEPVLSIT